MAELPPLKSAEAATGPEDRYADWQPIGAGGSADVYKVFDRELGIPLAIKILKEAGRRDPRQLQSLRSEVLISRALRHPNICPIHDLYEGPRGLGVVMDLLEGQDLRQWMDAQAGRLLDTMPERLTLLRRVTEALAVAHTHITHRDLKPANIYLKNGDTERPMIMDFGLSTLTDLHDGQFAGGTPKYMAPEQFEAPATVDHRSDLFALGIMAYELVTGGRIPPCSLQGVLRTRQVPRIPISQIEPPSRYCAAIPPALDRLILQLLSYDPKDRPQSAAEVRAALDGIKLGEAVHSGHGKDRIACNSVPVVAGVYRIGSGRFDALAIERPQRRVKLSAFSIEANPVTNDQYREFLSATGYRAPALLDHPVFGLGSAPVVMVTWAEANAYAKWIGGRLPTEAEWEAAARAGGDGDYPWGEAAPLPSQANIDGRLGATVPVDSYPSGRNAWKLGDMCGNVWEWCLDEWNPEYYRALADDVQDPCIKTGSGVRVIRGGSFDSLVEMGRCSFRFRAPEGTARPDIGFRILFSN